MLSESNRALVWTARIAGMALVALASLFALDAFNGQSLLEGIAAFAIHLIPAAVVAAVVLVAWKRPWLGAVGFGALAAAYAVSISFRPDWLLSVGGPLVVTAVLFALSAVATSRRQTGSAG